MQRNFVIIEYVELVIIIVTAVAAISLKTRAGASGVALGLWINGSILLIFDLFATPSLIFRERNLASALPIIGNGPPGTFVLSPKQGVRVSLPTDQIVFAEDAGGHARVRFGGMQFVGPEEGLSGVREGSPTAPKGSTLAHS